MRFAAEIETGNATFVEPGWRHELARLLRRAADRIEDDDATEGRFVEINGTSVGGWSIEHEGPN